MALGLYGSHQTITTSAAGFRVEARPPARDRHVASETTPGGRFGGGMIGRVGRQERVGQGGWCAIARYSSEEAGGGVGEWRAKRRRGEDEDEDEDEDKSAAFASSALPLPPPPPFSLPSIFARTCRRSERR